MRSCITFPLYFPLLMCLASVDSFTFHHQVPNRNAASSSFSKGEHSSSLFASSVSSGLGFGPAASSAPTTTTAAAVVETTINDDPDSLSSASMLEIKTKLLDLLPRMTGSSQDFALVETYVNLLESKYAPPQTLDFLNLALGGTWQLLFSTNLKGGPRSNFRLTELVQRVEPNQRKGSVVNVAQWDMSQAEENGAFDATATTVFDCSGTFYVVCSYEITQGARMVVELQDHKIELSKGSAVPEDVPGLVALLYRAMPTELFDPNGHAMDTTYLDGNLRIVRMTGPSALEGVRDIFIRSGSMEINPVSAA